MPKCDSLGVGRVAFTPDGKRIVSPCVDGTVRIWDSLNGQELLVLKCGPRVVTSVACNPDGKRIFGGCEDGTLLIWDATIDGERPMASKKE